MGNYTQTRKKICEDIDEKIIVDLDIIYNKLDIPKSRLCEEAIRYVLKQQIISTERQATRDDITLSINQKLWESFKEYTVKNNYKIVHLLEIGLKYIIKKYKNKMKKGYL